ncbi:MAG: ABC transporter ATP-binding protein [Thermoanaerobaculia bacterium]
MSGRPLIEADGVSFRYDEVTAVDGVSLVVHAGERIALLGPNGCGKSTLLRLLAALAFPHEGSIRFDGADLTEERLRDDAVALPFRRRVGLLFQNAEVQLFNPTVFDELAFGPLQLGWPRERIEARVAATLEEFGLRDLHDRSPHRLSGGEKKRVALASVLILEPDVLLLDEPTAMLDPRTQSTLIDFLSGSAGSGRTFLTTTHDLAILEDIADRCLVMQRGRLVADGTPHEILTNEPLLREAGLLHAHRHVHGGGVVHSHPHRHGGHEHD